MASVIALPPTTLITVGNLPERTRYTFANSIRGAWIKFHEQRSIQRVVILDTDESIDSREERNQVIRAILGRNCEIISTPCLEDFPLRTFQAIAEELQRPGFASPIIDITNGRRNETFALIVATTLSRIDDVIMTSIAREHHETPYTDLNGSQYDVFQVGPFSHHELLESAARFEIIYYSDRTMSIADSLDRLGLGSNGEIASRVVRALEHAILYYFFGQPHAYESAMSRLSLLLEDLTKTIATEIGGESQKPLSFSNAIDRLRGPVESLKSKGEESHQEYVRGTQLLSLLEYARNTRNLVQHPHPKRFDAGDVRFLLSLTFRAIDDTAKLVPLLKGGSEDVHSH